MLIPAVFSVLVSEMPRSRITIRNVPAGAASVRRSGAAVATDKHLSGRIGRGAAGAPQATSVSARSAQAAKRPDLARGFEATVCLVRNG